MSMSDCVKCWETPCTCGFYWKDHSMDAKIEQCKSILGDDWRSIIMDQWVRVDDRLPEKGEYLIMMDGQHWVAYFSGSDFCEIDCDRSIKPATHWMTLPDLPEGEDAEK